MEASEAEGDHYRGVAGHAFSRGAPLGRAVIGGVITSTLLTLFVIPTVYDILAGWRAALAKRLGKKPITHGEPVPAPGD